MVSDFTRRQFGALTAGGVAALAAGGKGAIAMESKPVDPLLGDTLFADVKTYVDFGIHHTGLAADLAVSDWQANHLTGLGFDVDFGAVPIKQHIANRSDLILEGGDTIAVWPQWPQPTASSDIAGALVDRTENLEAPVKAGDIVLLRVSGNTIDTEDNLGRIAPAFAAGASAVIAVSTHESGLYQIGNVWETTGPFPGPIMLAGSLDLPALKAALRARLIVEGEFQDVEGRSVTGRIDRGNKWIIVSTPQSGWTNCGGERGPGVALFRGLASVLGTRADGPSLCFTSNSGHEFHNLGARLLHDAHGLPDPADTALWVHLGAGFASRDWTVDEAGHFTFKDDHKGAIFMVTPQGKDLVSTDMTGLKAQVVSTDQFNVGEMLAVTKSGYDPAIGMVGYHSHHHIPGDREQTTAPHLLEGMARNTLAMIDQITS